MKEFLLVVKVGDRQFEAEFPTVGQIMEIQRLKQFYSGGNLGNMKRDYSKVSVFTVNAIEAFSHFSVLFPEMVEGLAVTGAKDFSNLRLPQAKPIISAYTKQFKKQFDSLMQEFYDEEETTED